MTHSYLSNLLHVYIYIYLFYTKPKWSRRGSSRFWFLIILRRKSLKIYPAWKLNQTGSQTLPLLLCTVGWVAKTEIYVLAVQPICPVQQTFRYCFNKDAILKSYRTYYFLKRCNIASFMICFVIFYRFGLAAL